jgi:hypothetical protein
VKLAICLFCLSAAVAQTGDIPTNIADTLGRTLQFADGQFLGAAAAMPESKYGFVPTGGNFEGVRSFVEQVKHVACAHFAFFNEIEGKTPPELCENGGPVKANTKAGLLMYLRDAFDGNRILAGTTAENSMSGAIMGALPEGRE